MTRNERSKCGDSYLFLKLASVFHFLLCSLVKVYLSGMKKKKESLNTKLLYIKKKNFIFLNERNCGGCKFK